VTGDFLPARFKPFQSDLKEISKLSSSGSVAYPLLYPSSIKWSIYKTRKRRLNMTNKKSILVRGLLVGALLLPAASALADDHKFEGDHHWSNDGKDGHHARREKHDYRRNDHHDNRGHHNKQEIRQDFKDVHNARNEVKSDRKELRGDYQELRKDRAELRRDIHNGASKQEIYKDRQEIRDDFSEINKDRTELQHDQGTLQSARGELKTDLRKR
jgi:septal ring factor EnvC (AmiA/AmiB activator)